MVFQLCREAEKHWRKINSYELIMKLYSDGIQFVDGIEKQVEILSKVVDERNERIMTSCEALPASMVARFYPENAKNRKRVQQLFFGGYVLLPSLRPEVATRRKSVACFYDVASHR